MHTLVYAKCQLLSWPLLSTQSFLLLLPSLISFFFLFLDVYFLIFFIPPFFFQLRTIITCGTFFQTSSLLYQQTSTTCSTFHLTSDDRVVIISACGSLSCLSKWCRKTVGNNVQNVGEKKSMFSWFSLTSVEKMLSGAFFPVLHHNLFLLQMFLFAIWVCFEIHVWEENSVFQNPGLLFHPWIYKQ